MSTTSRKIHHFLPVGTYLGERPSFTFAFRDTVTVGADVAVLDLLRAAVGADSVAAALTVVDLSNIFRFLNVDWETRALDWSFSTNFRFFTDPVPESRSAALRLTADVPVAAPLFLSVACSFFQLLERVVGSIARSDRVCSRYCIAGEEVSG